MFGLLGAQAQYQLRHAGFHFNASTTFISASMPRSISAKLPATLFAMYMLFTLQQNR